MYLDDYRIHLARYLKSKFLPHSNAHTDNIKGERSHFVFCEASGDSIFFDGSKMPDLKRHNIYLGS